MDTRNKPTVYFKILQRGYMYVNILQILINLYIIENCSLADKKCFKLFFNYFSYLIFKNLPSNCNLNNLAFMYLLIFFTNCCPFIDF